LNGVSKLGGDPILDRTEIIHERSEAVIVVDGGIVAPLAAGRGTG
jgi:hypothetical protein